MLTAMFMKGTGLMTRLVDMESIHIQMGLCTKAVGWKTSRRAMESKLGPMAPSMRAIINRAKKKVIQ
jgi:hypothetical protein